MSERWYIGVEGEPSGPFERAIVEQMRQDGRVAADTLVWREGMEDWVHYADAGLRPPLPPPFPVPGPPPPEHPAARLTPGAPAESLNDALDSRATAPTLASDTELPARSAPSHVSRGAKRRAPDMRGISMRGHIIILAMVALGFAYIYGSQDFAVAFGIAILPILIAGTVAWYKGPVAGYTTLAVILGILVLGECSRNGAAPTAGEADTASALGWAPFVSEREGWMAMFPEEPEVLRGSMERGSVKSYQATESFEEGGILYSVTVASREDGDGPMQGTMPPPDYLRRELQASLLLFEEEQLEVEDFVFTDGYPAIKASYYFTEEGERLRSQGVWILLPDRLFKVSVAYHVALGWTGVRRGKTFADSFAILDLESGR